MSDRLTDWRERLHTALVGVLPAWRVHATPPDQLVSPCLWIDVPQLFTQQLDVQGATTVVARWNVWFVVDGSSQAQVRQLDAGLAAAWDVLDAIPMSEAVTAVQQPRDVGGPSERAVAIAVETTLLSRTLCVPKLAPELVNA